MPFAAIAVDILCDYVSFIKFDDMTCPKLFAALQPYATIFCAFAYFGPSPARAIAHANNYRILDIPYSFSS
jgi:hypothetical protein